MHLPCHLPDTVFCDCFSKWSNFVKLSLFFSYGLAHSIGDSRLSRKNIFFLLIPQSNLELWKAVLRKLISLSLISHSAIAHSWDCYITGASYINAQRAPVRLWDLRLQRRENIHQMLQPGFMWWLVCGKNILHLYFWSLDILFWNFTKQKIS